ncbi:MULTISPECIES: 5-oxoprolinase subunit PxpB [unclassified Neisseria]|uniref:5-oxoprolinase subunit PxpB n=1 Tax=unclassified Neisseria TaxID=2623750 RepID=UPI002665D62F|nr:MULTISPECIES: 5-oxoprolinase subunit PxpB [unclassified Neisseria]MDO1510149.1 5-oxoprolinase subunit PxpB [Neisseria sp. MVDL19-042950]MDO1516725.1 5-oxoprolinase subunit PxpB [Neisseria sp. MVDL18-041461]MDO1563872.1 5-oxoprolinase subunit PxpB [Neisseria sp. MVDL20-010259]
MSTLKIITAGESVLVCFLPPPAALPKQRRLWAFADAAQTLPHVAEVVTGMNNVTVFARPQADLNNLSDGLYRLWEKTETGDHQGRHVDIPVCYGGEFGEDLAEVAAFHHTTPEEIVRRHTEPAYTVFMVGFQPGFPYLGGLPENLHTPRRAVPRTQVPAGSVGIGGSQTGIYPFASPGGWQIIGRTEIPLFQTASHPPTLLSAGDTVRFVAERICL